MTAVCQGWRVRPGSAASRRPARASGATVIGVQIRATAPGLLEGRLRAAARPRVSHQRVRQDLHWPAGYGGVRGAHARRAGVTCAF